MKNSDARYVVRPASNAAKSEFERSLLPEAINLLSLTRGHDTQMGDFFASAREALIAKYNDVFNPLLGQPK